MKHQKQTRSLRIALMAVMITTVLTSAAVFLGVGAASDEVSQSDLPPAEVTQSTEETADDTPEIQTIVISRTAPDFLTSNYAGKKGALAYKRFISSASYNGSYASELTDNEMTVYNGFVDAFVTQKKNYLDGFAVSFNKTLTLGVTYSDSNDAEPDMTVVEDCVLSAAAAFFYDHPEAFWIRSFDYHTSMSFTSGENIAYVNIISFSFVQGAYPYAYDDLAAYTAGVAQAKTYIAEHRDSASRYDTVKAIHDYVCEHASYDYAALSGSEYLYGYAYTPAPLFTGKGTFVCEGYSKSFKILCNEFGIPCALVSGTGVTSDTSSGPHMWDYVQMENGKWYGMDVTWDDGSVIDYDYFLIGSNTEVGSGKRFSQDHLPSGQVMTNPTKFNLIYPLLNGTAYAPDEVIEEPAAPDIILKTLGASIRLSDPYGIRYGIQLTKNDALTSVNVKEFGTLIIASGTLGSQELTVDTKSVRKIKANNIYSEDNSQLTYTGVLINIPNSFFGTKVKGRGYLIYTDKKDGSEHIIYSETVERTFLGVAQSAYDSYSKISNPTSDQKAVINKLKVILGKN